MFINCFQRSFGFSGGLWVFFLLVKNFSRVEEAETMQKELG